MGISMTLRGKKRCGIGEKARNYEKTDNARKVRRKRGTCHRKMPGKNKSAGIQKGIPGVRRRCKAKRRVAKTGTVRPLASGNN